MASRDEDKLLLSNVHNNNAQIIIDTEKCFFLIYKTEMKMVMVGLAAEGKTTTSCKTKLDEESTTILIIGKSFLKVRSGA